MVARTASKGEIINTYVKALFSLAQEEKILEEIKKGFNTLEEKLRKDLILMNKILYPGFREKEHELSLKRVCQGLPPLLQNFVGILKRYHRLNYLFPIMRAYEKYLEEQLGFLKVQVESAISLREEEKNFLKDYLKAQTGKEIILSLHENPKLLGGFRIQVNSLLIDCSLRMKVNVLEKTLRGKSLCA